MRTYKKVTMVGIILVILFIGLTCIWLRVSSARITNQKGELVSYRLYRSIMGNMYLEDKNGLVTIIYPHSNSITDPDSDVAIIRSNSWIALNPIRALIATDKPLALSHDPHLQMISGQISINIFEAERITIKF